MMSGVMASDGDGAMVFHRWSARKVLPVVLLYVTVVFAVFTALAIFVLQSREAVKALAIGWTGAIAATVPGVLEKIEYRLTAAGLDKRSHNTRRTVPFNDVFRWDELAQVVPMKHGFKYFKTLNETRPLRRFWKMHISSQHSGEVHAEKDDLDRVLGIVERQRASTQTPDGARPHSP